MNWYFESLDWQIIIYFPLAFLAGKEIKQKWRETFDANLTSDDRQVLQKINIFFLIPLVVLFHEIGHAAATIWAGGKVVDFHYGFWFGYVVPEGVFTPEQSLIIYLAGSTVQIVMGLIALLASLVVSSPPVVALLVYMGLFSIGGTIVIYTLLSFTGLYGDWIAIYSSPLTSWVAVIGAVHVILVAGLLYLLYGTAPRLWFSGKTRPKWKENYLKAKQKVEEDPSAASYLSLAWTYYYVGLNKLCKESLIKCRELDDTRLESWLLSGALENDRGNTKEAVKCFEQIADSPHADEILRSRALMAIGHCLSRDAEEESRKNKNAGNVYAPVMEAYRQASLATPEFADPEFYLATTLNKAGLNEEATQVFKDLQGKKWLDPALSELVGGYLRDARKRSDKEQ